MDRSSIEKKSAEHLEGANSKNLSPIEYHDHDHVAAVDEEFSGQDQDFARRTMRHVDWRVLPILAALYALSLIDRTNTSNAYVAGAALDLKLYIGDRYPIITLIFFVPYIIFELPANILVRRIGPAIWLGTITFLWGCVTIGMGFAKKWWHLVICRAFLGFLEAGFFPACAYLISTWYVRREVQKRMTAFYMLSVVVGGFSSAIAGGITKMSGTKGMNGWQWIFVLEGCATVFIAILAFFFVVDFPERNKFLTPEQTKYIVDRLEKDRGDVEMDSWSWAKFRSYCGTPKLWGFALMFGASTTVSYAFAYFLPIILEALDFARGSAINAQLLAAPPYFFSVWPALFFAWLSDKYIIRAPIIMVQACLSIVGLSMTAFAEKSVPRYIGVFLGLAGANANVASVLGYMQNNVVGQTKRAFTSALVIGFGGIGGIIASISFRTKDIPYYRSGLWVTIGANILVILIACLMTAGFWNRNRQVRAGNGRPIEGKYGFYYTL